MIENEEQLQEKILLKNSLRITNLSVVLCFVGECTKEFNQLVIKYSISKPME